MYEKKLKKTLSRIRMGMGMSQTALAKKMSTTQEYVCRMEGSGAVSLEKLAQYVKACGGEAKIVVKWHNVSDVDEVAVIRLTEKKNEGKK